MEDRTYTVRQLVNDPSFIEWSLGDSEGGQTEYWDQWVQLSEENRKVALRAQKQITGVRFQSPKTPDLKKEWGKVRSDILRNDQDKLTPEEQHTRGKRKRRLNYILKIAAVLLVCAFTGYAALSYQKPASQEKQVVVHTVKTDFEEKKTLNISDGSKIILAAGSQLSYRSNWLEKETKQITLEGEAYFSIAPKESNGKPKFIVQTADGSASVWGTRFTVNTYGKGTQVVLEEGEVRIEVDQARGDSLSEVKMEPGQMASFRHAVAKVDLKEVNPAVYTSWTTNELVFDETPFSVLVDRIRRTYGKEVIVRDQTMLDMNLSGSIDFRSLEGLTSAVSEVMNVHIYQSNETIIIESNQ